MQRVLRDAESEDLFYSLQVVSHASDDLEFEMILPCIHAAWFWCFFHGPKFHDAGRVQDIGVGQWIRARCLVSCQVTPHADTKRQHETTMTTMSPKHIAPQ